MGERVGAVRKKENRKEREREREKKGRKGGGGRESKKLLFVIAFELQKTTINGSLL